MQDTKMARSDRRSARWLAGSNVPVASVSSLVRSLLSARLAVRHKATTRCAPLYVLTVGAISSAMVDLPASRTDHAEWIRRVAVAYLAALVLLTAAKVLSHELIQRGDRAIGAGIAELIDAPRPASSWMVLGRARSTLAVTTLTISAVLGLVSVWLHPGWAGWTYLAAIAAICLIVRRNLRRVAQRPVVAVDSISLELDDELRFIEGGEATAPNFPLLFAFPSSLVLGTASPWLLDLWVAGVLFVTGVSLWARFSPPRQQAVPATQGQLPQRHHPVRV